MKFKILLLVFCNKLWNFPVTALMNSQQVDHVMIQFFDQQVTNKRLSVYWINCCGLLLQCFSAKSIFNEAKDEEHEEEEHGHAHEEHHGAEEKSLDQHDFEKASASIIFHLVQGFCIEEGHAHNETETKLPSKEFFLKEIFGNKTHLLEEDLKNITKVLGIGEKSTASSSSDKHSDHAHKHRRRRSTDFLSQLKLLKSHSIHRRAVDSHGHESGVNEHHATEAVSFLRITLTRRQLLSSFSIYFDIKVKLEWEQMKKGLCLRCHLCYLFTEELFCQLVLYLIIYMKKFLHSDWLRAVQFFFENSAEKR